MEVKGEVCVKLESGSLLPKAWKDLYYWCSSAIAPKEWIDNKAEIAPASFSNVDRIRIKETMTKF